ncbi:SAM-dependent methyltransferase [Pseudonocardia adelaidensis]|uniref:SAM-dependent methyltransferase n=1 Tax=Pseudonocardia adelaidensis TaxID=648754 RepID=A0ABP9NIM2_9PSEU
MDLAIDRAHGARIYDYILGGKDNYAVDRAAGDASLRLWPALRVHMSENRSFMHRVARHLAERGVRQFLDIGTGIPTSPNLHEVVQAVAPDARIVYVDSDPTVLAHARARMTSTPEGRTAYVCADMREPDTVLNAPQLRATLDLGEPVGLTLIAVLHFIAEDDLAHQVVQRLVDALAPGSFVGASIATDDFAPVPLAQVQHVYEAYGETVRWRSKAQAEKFFAGLEILDPGIVQIHKWRPQRGTAPIADADIAMYGAVARKP